MTARIVVVGSLNHDVTVWVPRRPQNDETIHGNRVEEFAGGKGANQAVAAARLDAEVTMVGCVGKDGRGDFLLAELDAAGVNRAHVSRVDTSTGIALITVDADNVSIVVVAGANDVLDRERIEAAATAIKSADVLLLQGEVGAEASRTAALFATASSTLVLFNPAPFNDVAQQVLPLADVVVVNRYEAQQLGDAEPPVLITTLGADGCEVRIDQETTRVAAPKVEVIDPTGAGDAFVGAFAVAFVDTGDPIAAATIAVRAGAAAVASVGAQPGMPTWQDIDNL